MPVPGFRQELSLGGLRFRVRNCPKCSSQFFLSIEEDYTWRGGGGGSGVKGEGERGGREVLLAGGWNFTWDGWAGLGQTLSGSGEFTLLFLESQYLLLGNIEIYKDRQ